LTREQVLRAGISFANECGIEALSMRRLGRRLGVEAMSLYNHVSGKDDMLDGMVDLVWSEVTPPPARGDWRAAIRKTAVSAHKLLLQHPWAGNLTISLGRIHPARLRYIDAILGRLTKAGLPEELIYHGYHAIDSHVIGFSMWVSGHSVGLEKRAKVAPPEVLPFDPAELAHLGEHARQHRTGVGPNNKDEFTFVLDLILEGLDRARV